MNYDAWKLRAPEDEAGRFTEDEDDARDAAAERAAEEREEDRFNGDRS